MLITAERDGYFGLWAKPALGHPWSKKFANSATSIESITKHLAEAGLHGGCGKNRNDMPDGRGIRHEIQQTVQDRNSSVEDFIGKQVVVDVEAPFVYLGRLHAIHDKTLVLKGVDVHDLRDSATTREVYVRESRVHGIQPNRKTVYILLEKVVSVSPLEDVME